MSPSGKYLLRLPIEPQGGIRVWKLTITDRTGKVLYKDDESRMGGRFNVYWGWDAQDRAWLYNSDDGQIWRWELVESAWKRIASERSDGIPDYVLPDYEKQR